MSIKVENQSSFEFKNDKESSSQKKKNLSAIKSINEKIEQNKKTEESKTWAKIISRINHLLD